MLDLGEHARFIWGSYAAVAMGLAGLVVWLVLDGQRHARRLRELEARGLGRKPLSPNAPGKDAKS